MYAQSAVSGNVSVTTMEVCELRPTVDLQGEAKNIKGDCCNYCTCVQLVAIVKPKQLHTHSYQQHNMHK